MLKKYKNKLFYLIEGWGYNVKNFEFSESTTQFSNGQKLPNYILKIKDTSLGFTFHSHPNDFHQFKFTKTEFNPKFTKTAPSSYQEFELVKDEFRKWLFDDLSDYFDEIDTKDFWDVIENNDEVLLKEINFNGTTPFTKEEKDSVTLALNQFQETLLKNHQFLPAQINQIEKSVNYIKSKIDSNKIDWKNITVGTIITLIVALNVDTDIGKMIWFFFQEMFHQLPLLK